MDRIESRTDLVTYIEQRINRSVIKAAIHEGSIFVAGAFRQVPPKIKPGWIVIITSRFGRTWNIAVTPNDNQRTFDVWEISKIPWEFHYRVKNFAKTGDIYDGDNPAYAELMIEQQKLCKPNAAANSTGKNETNHPQL